MKQWLNGLNVYSFSVPKNPSQGDRSHGCAYVGTTMSVVFIVLEVEVMTYCTAPLTFLLLAGRRLEPNFLRRVGLTGSQFLEGICWQVGGDLSQEGLQFLRKK